MSIRSHERRRAHALRKSPRSVRADEPPQFGRIANRGKVKRFEQVLHRCAYGLADSYNWTSAAVFGSG
jgi:hypothetical protein